MTPDLLRAFLRGGVFVAGLAFVLALTVPRDSAEFIVSVCSVGIGLAIMGLAIGILWIGRR